MDLILSKRRKRPLFLLPTPLSFILGKALPDIQKAGRIPRGCCSCLYNPLLRRQALTGMGVEPTKKT